MSAELGVLVTTECDGVGLRGRWQGIIGQRPLALRPVGLGAVVHVQLVRVRCGACPRAGAARDPPLVVLRGFESRKRNVAHLLGLVSQIVAY